MKYAIIALALLAVPANSTVRADAIDRAVKAAAVDLHNGTPCVRITIEHREVNYARC